MEFMARLAALLPPPKIPFVRYHGVFASRSSWRPLVTPKPPPEAAKPKPCDATPTRLDLLPPLLARAAHRHDEDVAVHIDARGDVEHDFHRILRRLRKWLAVG